MDRIEYDLLPPIGARVQIHLNSVDQWVDHEVVGYYVWDNLHDYRNVHRVFVRVVDGEGYLNSRLLNDVRWNGNVPNSNEDSD